MAVTYGLMRLLGSASGALVLIGVALFFTLGPSDEELGRHLTKLKVKPRVGEEV